VRAKNMQALTNDIYAKHPGVVIYGIGDEAHQDHPSDHNEDDTPGSKASQSDADNNPEHRAIDVMIGPKFTKAQAYNIINGILADPKARKRLKYIIFDRKIWSASNGWVEEEYEGSDPHTNHIHFSGLAADDENAASWPAVQNGGSMSMESEVHNLYAAEFYGGSSCGEKVKDEYRTRKPDGTFANQYGNSNVEKFRQLLGEQAKILTALENMPAGPEGPQGPQGEPGKDATWPANITITGVADAVASVETGTNTEAHQMSFDEVMKDE
jgi:hypothetical protein